MTSIPRDIVIETLDWRGVLIEISYEPRWLGDNIIAHLELRTIQPDCAPLPITETGYKSHFIPRGCVEDMGGPTAYVLAWLADAAKRKGWADIEAAARQYTLF
jgi:hypothetical protein